MVNLIDGRTIKLTLPMGGTYSGGEVGNTLDLYSSYYEPEPFASDNSCTTELTLEHPRITTPENVKGRS